MPDLSPFLRPLLKLANPFHELKLTQLAIYHVLKPNASPLSPVIHYPTANHILTIIETKTNCMAISFAPGIQGT